MLNSYYKHTVFGGIDVYINTFFVFLICQS